jgi:hypothetical protein
VYVDGQLEHRAGLGKQTIVCFNDQELPQERVNLACSRARKKGSEYRIIKPQQNSKSECAACSRDDQLSATAYRFEVKRHNQPRIISFRTPSPATVGGNNPAPAAVNGQGASEHIEGEGNDGLGILPQQPLPTLRSVPVPNHAPESFQAWMELDRVPTTPAICEPMIDYVGATEIELAFSFDEVDVVDIDSVLGAEIGTSACGRTVTAIGLLTTIRRCIYYNESTYAQLPAARNDSVRFQLQCNEEPWSAQPLRSIVSHRMHRSQLQHVPRLLWP